MKEIVILLGLAVVMTTIFWIVFRLGLRFVRIVLALAVGIGILLALSWLYHVLRITL